MSSTLKELGYPHLLHSHSFEGVVTSANQIGKGAGSDGILKINERIRIIRKAKAKLSHGGVMPGGANESLSSGHVGNARDLGSKGRVQGGTSVRDLDSGALAAGV